jgi:hypothetical protein
MHYRTLVEHDSTSVQRIFNWSTSVVSHKKWTVVFTQRKALPRSTANSTVSNSNFGALSVLLFNANFFHINELSDLQHKNSQTRTKMLYVCNTNRVMAHPLYSTMCYHTTQIHIYPQFVWISIGNISVTQNHQQGNHASVLKEGTAVAQWLRYSATNRKVACSIPDGVIEIFC